MELRLECDFRSLHATLREEWPIVNLPPFPKLRRSRLQRAQQLQLFLSQILAAAAQMGEAMGEMHPVPHPLLP